MNEKLKNTFSIGLSLSISLEEYKELITKYAYYLNSIYFSLPLGNGFHSRVLISKEFENPENIKLFYEILKLFKDNGIKLDCVFNTPRVTEEELLKALKVAKENIMIDQVTCLQKDIEVINEMLPGVEKIYSYNNNLEPGKINEISTLFDTVVLGKRFLRDYKLVREVYSRGFDIKLLINNGCAFNCGGCYGKGKSCKHVFEHNLEKYSIDELYALQSFYPFELKEFLDVIDIPIKYLKIANRTSGYEYLDKCLESYINNSDVHDLVSENPKNYRIWGRQSNLNPYLKNLNEETIESEKKRLLKKSRECI